MSGTGGVFDRFSSESLSRKMWQEITRVNSQSLDTKVNGYLASLLTSFNERDVDGTRDVLGKVEKDLETQIEGTVHILFGGSVSKHTYVDGISDVDALMLLNDSELADKGPNETKRFLADCLSSRYGENAVHIGDLAVTLSVEDNTIQILPALRQGDGFKIASYGSNSWSKISPRRFADKLTRENHRLSSKLVPCIKLIKSINSTLPKKRQMSGYHIEALAIEVYKRYDGQKTPKSMLRHFFEHSAHAVMTPIKDSSGQSVHVDDKFGGKNSVQRRVVAESLDRIGRRMRNADAASSFEQWKILFE